MSNWDSWIGKTTSTEAYVDPTQVQKLEVTLGRDPILGTGDQLPPAWHWVFFHDLANKSELGLDGHPKLGKFLPEFELTRRMWAGGTINWLNKVEIGQTAAKHSKIINIEQKTGRSGDLIFVTLEHLVVQKNVVCISEIQNIVYRQPAGFTQEVAKEQASRDSDFEKTWQLTATDLFRYSALTFNGHRIHYDADYTRDVEGYPGLVVHGPLLATLMLDLASQNKLPINSFKYRAISPVTLPNEFKVCGKEINGETKLWITSENGTLAMDATLN